MNSISEIIIKSSVLWYPTKATLKMRGLHNGITNFAWICISIIYIFRTRIDFKGTSVLFIHSLMSGANAISGIALVGALTLAQDSQLQTRSGFFCNYICINKCFWRLSGNQSNVENV